MKTSTRCVQLGTGDDQHGAIVPPIYQTATFQQPTATEFGEYDYSRSGNPTRDLLEQQLADLEEGKHAAAFASGMAAITALVRLVESGGEIIAGDDLYGGTVRLLERVAANQNIPVQYVDTSDLIAVAGLINDLDERGLLDSTLVIALGEFGRTPKISTLSGQSKAGRDHWANAMSVLFAGGGTPGGTVVGATDAKGFAAVERVLAPENFVSTVYTKLGIDPGKILYNTQGRPSHLVSDPTPIKELMG